MKRLPVIGNLQVLRGVAALAVVFYHADFHLPGDVHTDFAGVSTFFVISGFIMCYISRTDPDFFFLKRVMRIVPLYWLSTAALAILSHPSALLHPNAQLGEFVPHVIGSLFFLPSDAPPILAVGWTLNFEMYFYLAFAVSLSLHRKFAPIIAACLVVAVSSLPSLGCDRLLCTFYSHGYIRFFVAGIVLFYAWIAISHRLPKAPTVACGLTVIMLCYATQFDFNYFNSLLPGFSPFSWMEVMPVLIVAASLLLTSVGADIQWRPLILFGDASYATYLTHIIFMERLNLFTDSPVIPSTDENVFSMISVIAACLAIGIGVHLYVEKPIGRLVRDKFLRLRVVLASAAAAGRSASPDAGIGVFGTVGGNGGVISPPRRSSGSCRAPEEYIAGIAPGSRSSGSARPPASR